MINQLMTMNVLHDIENMATRPSHVVLLIGCYPERDDPCYHHEYPAALLHALGGYCFVALIDPRYKTHPHKLPPMHKRGTNVFTIYPSIAEGVHLADIDAMKNAPPVMLYDFTGASNVYEILKTAGLGEDYLDRYYIHFDPSESSSCMTRVDNLVRRTHAREIIRYLTTGSATTASTAEIYKTAHPIVREFSSWLRREHMFLASDEEFYGRAEYRSMVADERNIRSREPYYIKILGMIQGESLLDRFEVFLRRLGVKSTTTTVHDLAVAYSNITFSG